MIYFTRDTQTQKGFLLLLGVFCSFFFIESLYAQSDSDYLKSLEGEVSTLSLDNQTKNSVRKPPKKTLRTFSEGLGRIKGGAISELIPGLTIDQFERVLKNNYIGSYLFYKRLNSSKKDQVYSFYQKSPDPNEVRKKILQVSKK